MFLAWYNGGEFGFRWWINRECEEGINLMMRINRACEESINLMMNKRS